MRKHVPHKLERGTTEQLLSDVLDAVADPVLVIGLDYRILYANTAARRTYGVAGPGLPDTTPCHQLTHGLTEPCDAAEHTCPLTEVLESGGPARAIHDHLLASGQTRKYELTATPLRATDGAIIGIVEIAHDVTERVRLEETLRQSETRMSHLARHDPLTGLPNRILLLERIDRAMARARRSGGMAAVLFLDLDGFKQINDTGGHTAGDHALRIVAERLRSCSRETDTVARAGGDEFAFVLEQVANPQQVATVARKILDNLDPAIELDGQKVRLGGSIGASLFPNHGDDANTLLGRADAAMYTVKAEGGNGYALFEENAPDSSPRKT